MKSKKSGSEKEQEVETGGAHSGEKNNKWNHNIFSVLVVSLLTLLIAGGAFAAGYCINDNDKGANKQGSGRQKALLSGKNLAEKQKLREQLKKRIESGEAQAVRGAVTSVEGDRITVETQSGNQVVGLTASTKYVKPGVGTAPEGGGTSKARPAVGDRVLVIAEKGQGENLEAMVVRVMGQRQATPAQ